MVTLDGDQSCSPDSQAIRLTVFSRASAALHRRRVSYRFRSFVGLGCSTRWLGRGLGQLYVVQKRCDEGKQEERQAQHQDQTDTHQSKQWAA